MAARKHQFYLWNSITDKWEQQEGYRVVIEGVEFFVYKSDQLRHKREPWFIIHGRCGLRVVSGDRTKKGAIERLKRLVERNGINFIEETAEKAIQHYGLSPKYEEAAEAV